MLGAIIGDIIGSIYEFRNIKTKNFNLFDEECFFTDDTVMTAAIAEAILNCEGDYSKLREQAVTCMQTLGRLYPEAGYGSYFRRWIKDNNPQPYNSFGNGSAMRVSPCGYVAKSLDNALEFAKITAEATHNHPEGIKGAQAVAACIFLSREGKSIPTMAHYIHRHFYDMSFTLDEIRADYRFDETCQGSVPQALKAFFESSGFEDAIRNAISIGGDSDTIAAITGSVAQAYYGIPNEIRETALQYLDGSILETLTVFEEYCKNM